MISNIKTFHETISLGLEEVLKGNIVAFGIQPTRPEIGYGYLSLSKIKKQEAMKVKQFVEKPDPVTAQSMINAGSYL